MHQLTTIDDLRKIPSDVLLQFMSWAEDLKPMYENFIEQDSEDVSFNAGWHGAKRRVGGIHASEISGDCKRQVWYSLQGAERQDANKDPFWKKKFRVGHMYHAMVQNDWERLAKNSGGLITFEAEVKINPGLQEIARQYDIHSSGDGLITFHDKPYGAPVLRVGLEIKTESGDQFGKLKETRTYHARQCCVYMRCLDVPVFWSMYWNKSNQNIIDSKPPFLFTFDFALWDTIEKEAQEVHRLNVLNEAPPRKEGMVCEFCGYGHLCKPRYLERKEARKKARIRREARNRKRPNTLGITTKR